MKKIFFITAASALFLLFMFGAVIGSFDFNRTIELGESEYFLMDGCPPGTRRYGLFHTSTMEAVIGGNLKDVYWNDDYILVTISHPEQCDSVTGHYIVKRLPLPKKGVPWRKTGPLSEDEYERIKKELNLNEKSMNYINALK